MRTRLPLLFVLVLVACGGSASESESEAAETDQAQRASMRSAVEGRWTGPITFADGRAATTMTLELRYSGTGQTTVKCGSRTLASDLQPTCATLYTLPLSGTISTADGARKNEPVSLTYGNLEGLVGPIAAGDLEATMKNGKLEGKVIATGIAEFSLSRAAQ